MKPDNFSTMSKTFLECLEKIVKQEVKVQSNQLIHYIGVIKFQIEKAQNIRYMFHTTSLIWLLS